ncbi:MAG TPA: hypothetical protein VG498_21230 [Terriglobales bacterium]|nr:hypothetical protein [Terriglobales bacterium]
MISIHLSDPEISAAAAGERCQRTAQHLQICGECQQQVEIYRERMQSLRRDVIYSAGRSAIDWGKQSRAIQQGILAAHIRKTHRNQGGFALAASVLAAMLLIVLFFGFRDMPPTTKHGITLSDAALLNDVEAQLDEELPDALQPASLLVGEMGGLDNETTPHKHARTRNRQ